MTHRLQRILFHPMTAPCFAAFLLLAANLVPRVQYGIPSVPYPGSGERWLCSGVLEYGWPKTARIDEFIEYDIVDTPILQSRYSLKHFWGMHELDVKKTHRSVSLTHFVNAAFMLAAALLFALGTRAISNRRFSLKSLFAAVTLVGILIASFSWNGSLSMSKSWPLNIEYPQQNNGLNAEASKASFSNG